MLSTSGRKHETLDIEVDRLRNIYFGSLDFPHALEDQFEFDTAKRRSHRLWLEGLLAIVALNACLLLDLIFVRDARWQSVVLSTLVITPLALVVNALMRLDLKRWMREGCVALGATAICFINTRVEGNATAVAVSYSLMCVLIMVLFVGVVMRIRLPYAAAAIAAMGIGGLCAVASGSGLKSSEKIIGASLLIIGVVITMTATYSLEREERLTYLLTLRSTLQTEELAALNVELRDLSTLDKLTGLPNRRAFDERFEELWVRSELKQTPLSAILIDVDHFKVLNDVFGHLHGDLVLQRIASLLPQALRGHQDLVARYGGEEFTVLLPETGLETALIIAERIRSLIEVAGTPVSDRMAGELVNWTTVSCGVSTCVPGPGLSRETLLEAADQALYCSKESGRNQVSHQQAEQDQLR